MNIPAKMLQKLEEERSTFRERFYATLAQLECLGLHFHPQESPNIIAEHPRSRVNCVVLWIRGAKGARRIDAEVRVDSWLVDDLSIGMRNDIVLRKYDRGKKPIWWLLTIGNESDIDKLCHVIRRMISRNPNWESK